LEGNEIAESQNEGSKERKESARKKERVSELGACCAKGLTVRQDEDHWILYNSV
jgi:hypothetical protein